MKTASASSRIAMTFLIEHKYRLVGITRQDRQGPRPGRCRGFVRLKRCYELRELPAWLGALTGLQELDLYAGAKG